jgi:hypothetical protein
VIIRLFLFPQLSNSSKTRGFAPEVAANAKDELREAVLRGELLP